MKNLLFGLLLGIFVASVPLAYTQQRPERLYIGDVRIQLGMEKDAVISKLAERGYKLTKIQPSDSSNEGWLVSLKNEQTDEYDGIGNLQFSNGRLLWAVREWAENWDTGSAKVGKNLYFLAKSLEESGNTSCSLETKAMEGPEFDSKETLIHCGRRTVNVGVSKYKEQHEETQVSETVK